ncbi:MAG TPA: zinc ribbon domain-containing protein [Planctomycetota bacterium]
MNCPACGVAGEIRDGRCQKCGEAPPPPTKACPKCAGPIALGELFCPACGHKMAPPARPSAAAAYQRRGEESTVRTGRGWILAVSILTLLWSFVQFGIGKSEVEKQIANAERQLENVDPEARDEHFKKTIGMTWDEAIAHDRGQVTLLFVINLALAGLYFGLWWWASRNAFTAALIALILFISVALISAIVDPKTIVQGILVKVLFIAALSKAVSAAYAQRKLREAGA